jgi:hypothetical protein
MTLIQTTYGKGKCNAYMTISKCTLYVGGKMQYWQYDLKSTLFIRGQNVKSIYQTWNILNGMTILNLPRRLSSLN